MRMPWTEIWRSPFGFALNSHHSTLNRIVPAQLPLPMKSHIRRKDFVRGAGILAGAALLSRSAAQTPATAPQIRASRTAKPVVIASANGNNYKDASGLTCVAKAFKLMTEGTD